MPEEIRRRNRWRLILTLVTFLAFAATIIALRHQIVDSLLKLGEVNAFALLFIIPLQFANYHSQTKLYQSLFGILGEKVDYRFMLRTASELNFVNNVFPSGGVSGFSYLGIKMREKGISAGRTTLVQTMKLVLIFVAFQALLVVGLFLLALEGRANSLVLLVAGSLATLLLVGTLGFAFIIGSRQRINAFFTFITQLLNRLIYLVRRNHPETINVKKAQGLFTDFHENYLRIKDNLKTLQRPLIFASLTSLSEIMTIYMVYIAFGNWVNPGAVILAYAVANFAGLISVLPGGIGIYEALMTAVLAASGVPAGLSIPVTVMYRVVNMLLQLPLGYYFYHQTINSHDYDQK